ncbi:Structural maintenance of chromosomes protein 1 [Gurleya vavrai]
MQRDRNEINLIQKECFLIEDKIEELDEKIKKEEKREFQEDNLKDEIIKKESAVNDLILEIKMKKTRIESCKTEINVLQKNFFEIKKGYENDNKFYLDEKIKEQFNSLEETFKKEAFEEIENINNLNYKVKPQKEKIKQYTKNINEITNKLELYKKEEYNKNYLINDILKIINTNNNIINLMVDKKKEGFQKFNLINEEELNLNREFGMILKNIMSHKSFVKEDERKNKIHEAIEVLKSNFSGVYGRFIDLISLTQKKYELGLSVLIGNYDQAVIVDNEKTAIECIKYIKLKKIGRVTFLPLNSLKVKQINRCSSDKIYAIDTIVFDDLYKKAVLFVLGNSIVCEDFMKAKNIFDLENLNEKIVTLDGTLFHQNGNITAGKIDSKFTEKNLSLLLKRKNEILERLKEIKNLKSQFHHIEIANEKIKEIDNENEKLNKKIKEEGDKKDFLSKLIKNLEEQIINLENEKNDLLNEIFEFDKNKQNFEIRKKKKEDEIFYNFIYKKNLSEFRDFLKDRNIFLSKKEAEFNELKDNYEFEIKNLFENINELEENVKTQNLNLIELKNKANKQNNKIELLKFKNLEIEKLDLIKEKFCHKRKELENQNESLNKKINQINAIGKELIILEKNILRLKEENFELIKLMQLEEIKIPFINKKMQIDNLDDKSKINSEKNYLETKNSSKKKDFNFLNIEDEEISMDSYESSKENELNVIKKVDKNYLNLIDMDQIDFSNLKDENIYIKEYKEICKDLEENIPVGQFKEINYQGDYAKISFEYDEARKDALKSKEIFNNIKEKRSEMFMQCFEKINENIGLIYRDLTRTEESEGNAYLLLENNVEAYKEGTKYFIMPPKKRYREINMLSGGEKTLAAFALLLSFHFYKPSSFYIFDELDSALDKTNVKRITDFILKSKIQFIAITLKPDFFQYADGLVGIYKLKEKSKVLTLKL